MKFPSPTASAIRQRRRSDLAENPNHLQTKPVKVPADLTPHHRTMPDRNGARAVQVNDEMADPLSGALLDARSPFDALVLDGQPQMSAGKRAYLAKLGRGYLGGSKFRT